MDKLPIKPLLKWAGGKARLASQISQAFGKPCEGTYYEPFLGSAAVFLYRRARGEVGRAVLSDANAKLIEVHRAIRDQLGQVLDHLGSLPQADWREHYYAVRERYNQGPCKGARHAARFIWLNRAGYNGLYRENKSGRYNVPIGSYAKLSFPSPQAFAQVSELLQGVELVAASFEQVVTAAAQGDQVYCDPPYVPLSETACFTGYCNTPFGLTEQRTLGQCAQRAALRGARVVLSNHDLPVVRNELYPLGVGFEHIAKPRVARAISRNAKGRAKVGEVIAAIGPRAMAG